MFAGVYAVGHRARSRRADISAAALGYGSAAFGTATELLGVEERQHGPIHVLAAPGRTPLPRPGIVVHRTRHLAQWEVGIVDGIQCTRVPRALADIATVRSRAMLTLAINRADARGLLDVPAVLRCCRGGVRGHDVLRDLLVARDPVDTYTAALFVEILEEFGLPVPEFEVAYRDWRLDVYYREQSVAIELNDYGTHALRHRFERDHDLAAALRQDGIAFQPFSYRQLTAARRVVAETTAALLGVRI